MKYVVLIPDGASDYPLEELSGKTPLQVADMPNIKKLARQSTLGLVKTVPNGFVPGSDVANLSIFGYDPVKYFSGRGPIEAAYRGIKLSKHDTVFRCNLITVDNERITDYSASHIETDEASQLIADLDAELGTEKIKFYPGISYRHLVVFKDTSFENIEAIAPHDAIGQKIDKIRQSGVNSQELIDLTKKSVEVLENHEINKKRRDKGLNPANMIWLWGGGRQKNLPSFYTRFGLKGGVISAVDLIKGLAVSAGLEVVNVAGATGYFDTDYEAKADRALSVLKDNDFVYVHVEAPDEAGHVGNIEEKIKALENIDKRLFLRLLNGLDMKRTKIMILPDHGTPLSLRTHVSDPVPFMIYPGEGGSTTYNEEEAKKNSSAPVEGHKLMKYFIEGDLI